MTQRHCFTSPAATASQHAAATQALSVTAAFGSGLRTAKAGRLKPPLRFHLPTLSRGRGRTDRSDFVPLINLGEGPHSSPAGSLPPSLPQSGGPGGGRKGAQPRPAEGPRGPHSRTAPSPGPGPGTPAAGTSPGRCAPGARRRGAGSPARCRWAAAPRTCRRRRPPCRRADVSRNRRGRAAANQRARRAGSAPPSAGSGSGGYFLGSVCPRPWRAARRRRG